MQATETSPIYDERNHLLAMESWTNTRNTLSKLRKLLVCSHCSKPLSDPYFLESCRHTFCRTCIKNETCPECHISAHSKEITPNRLVSNVMLFTSQLQRLLDNEDLKSPCPKSPPSSKKIITNGTKKDVEPICKKITVLNETATEKPDDMQNENVIPLDQSSMNANTPERDNAKQFCDHSESQLQETTLNGTEYSAFNTPVSTPNRQTLIKVQDFRPATPSSCSSQKKNSKGETPLHIACIKGDALKAKKLLQEGANPNMKDNAGWTPLHEASHHDFLEIVTLLIRHNAFINTPGYDNETPLHDAVHMNNIDVVAFLVRHGADTNARNARGLTPLDLAKTKEMKAALKTTVSLSFAKESPSNNSAACNQQVVILCTGLSRKQKHQIQLCNKMLKFTLVEEFSNKVTHIITDCDDEGQCTRTLKYLQGVLGGKWILNFTWIEMCIEYKRKIDEEAFEVAGTKIYPNSFGARKGRENTLRQLPQLFDGCHFYFSGTFAAPWPQRSELLTLIRSGGGKVLKREPRYDMKDDETHRVPYHLMHNIVNTFVVHAQDEAPQFNNLGDNVCCVHITWLLDSISTFSLLPFDYKH